jgi:hypothetical protein
MTTIFMPTLLVLTGSSARENSLFIAIAPSYQLQRRQEKGVRNLFHCAGGKADAQSGKGS